MKCTVTLHTRNWLSLLLCIIVSFFSSLSLQAQNTIRIKGHIIDESNKPVGNVTISIKGTSSGTSSDAKGNFEILAPSNGTLVISSVGFTQKEVDINGRQTVDIKISSAI